MQGIATACEKCCGLPNEMDCAMSKDQVIGFHVDTADVVYMYEKKVHRGASA